MSAANVSISARQWKMAALYLEFLGKELSKSTTFLQEIAERTEDDGDELTLRETAEGLAVARDHLLTVRRKLASGEDLLAGDEAIFSILLDHEEDEQAGVYALPSELQEEIDRDFGDHVDADDRW
jgi:hypothetical protein